MDGAENTLRQTGKLYLLQPENGFPESSSRNRNFPGLFDSALEGMFLATGQHGAGRAGLVWQRFHKKCKNRKMRQGENSARWAVQRCRTELEETVCALLSGTQQGGF